jgi:hypothetical protein
MRAITSWCSLSIVAIAAVILAAPAKVFADTYQVFNLGSDQDYFFYGMDDSGDVVIDRPNGSANPACIASSSTCYISYFNGVFTGESLVAPTFTPDNGGACTPSLPPGTLLVRGVCNGGSDAFTGRFNPIPPPYHYFVYAGPDNDLLGQGGNFIYMNSLGDIVFDDIYDEYWFEAVDLTTEVPEPDSIFLLGTGAFVAATSTRRRLFR